MIVGVSLNFAEIDSAFAKAIQNKINNFEIFYNFDAKPTKTNLEKTWELFLRYRKEIQSARIFSVHLPPYSVDDPSFINHIQDKILNMHEIGFKPVIFVVHCQKQTKRWKYTINNLNKMRGLIHEIMGYEPNIVIENLTTKAFHNKESLDSIPKDINYKLCVDITHFNQETQDVIEFLDILNQKGWLGHIHASDISRTDVGIVDPFRNAPQTYHLPPGRGILDWHTIVMNLQKIQYNSAFIIECMNFDQTLEGYKYICSIMQKIEGK